MKPEMVKRRCTCDQRDNPLQEYHVFPNKSVPDPYGFYCNFCLRFWVTIEVAK